MARHPGPRVKEMRALGTLLPGPSSGAPIPPVTTASASPFKVRLQEKQKLRLNYGVTERQLPNLMRVARKRQARADHVLMELLERRLDNLVFRAGFARTIPAARQLVRHGHVQVDGATVDVAAMTARLAAAPSPDTIPFDVTPQLVVEFYAKRL